jgi:DNA modification methylase
MTVRAGNGMITAARRLGWLYIAALVVDEPERDARRYALADNRTGELAEWDSSVLLNEIGELKLSDERIEIPGFELGDLLDWQAPPRFDGSRIPETVDEALADSDIPKRVSPGDVWEVGAHRIICGDVREATPLVTDAAMLITDPPYGVDFVARGKKKAKAKIVNDDLAPKEMAAFISSTMRAISAWLGGGAAAYVFHPDQRRGAREVFEAGLDAADIEMLGSIVWVKAAGSMGWQDYRNQYEPCLYGSKRGGTRRKVVDRTQTTVWRVDREPNNQLMHPTQKPVALIARAIENSTRVGDVVVDGFGGSGSMVVAAELMGRAGYSIELEPRYCDMAIERLLRANKDLEARRISTT